MICRLCSTPARARGLCLRCYHRERYHGTETTHSRQRLTADEAQRILASRGAYSTTEAATMLGVGVKAARHWLRRYCHPTRRRSTGERVWRFLRQDTCLLCSRPVLARGLCVAHYGHQHHLGALDLRWRPAAVRAVLASLGECTTSQVMAALGVSRQQARWWLRRFAAVIRPGRQHAETVWRYSPEIAASAA